MAVTAQQIYDSLVKMLEERDWKFRRFDEDLVVSAIIGTQDLPVEFTVRVNESSEALMFRSVLPIKFPENKRVEGAVATCVASYGLPKGCFEYDISDGEIAFRFASSYVDTVLSDDLMEKMILYSAGVIDRYNDNFFALAKGFMTLDDFISKENE